MLFSDTENNIILSYSAKHAKRERFINESRILHNRLRAFQWSFGRTYKQTQ